MEPFKKYSYEDWWDGKICLIYATILIKKARKQKSPTRVSWEHIIKSDILKIQEKQKDIFNNAVTKKLEEWKRIFKERHTNSKVPRLLLAEEFKKFKRIILDPMPKNAYQKSEYFGTYFEYNSLSTIKNFIYETKVNGAPINFDFVHSPNCKYQNKDLNQEQVYAECCWQYIEWLKEFYTTNKKKKLDSIETPASIQKNEIDSSNPFQWIFKNRCAYQFFLELKKEIVVKGSELADYSFIYNKMKYGDSKAINNTVTHTIYINFLNEKQGASISYPKLTNSKTSKKEIKYNDILEKYKDLI